MSRTKESATEIATELSEEYEREALDCPLDVTDPA